MFEKLMEVFIKTDRCQFCGSQRCERDEEWMKGCKDFRDFCKQFQEYIERSSNG